MKDCFTLSMWHTKMHFSAKCNSGRVAIQWFHIKHYLDYQFTKFQPYTFRVQKMCVFARYATLVPRLCIKLSVLEPTSASSYQSAKFRADRLYLNIGITFYHLGASVFTVHHAQTALNRSDSSVGSGASAFPAAPYQRCKNGTCSSLDDTRIYKGLC